MRNIVALFAYERQNRDLPLQITVDIKAGSRWRSKKNEQEQQIVNRERTNGLGEKGPRRSKEKNSGSERMNLRRRQEKEKRSREREGEMSLNLTTSVSTAVSRPS